MFQLANGQTFGQYTIASRIGAGGMGEIYLAVDARLNRRVALKLLSSAFIKAAERVRRFEQEAAAVSAINHPNILTIYEVGQVESVHFIATEFVEGDTLRKVITRGPMSPTAALGIAVQISSALAAAHEAGVVHRDIKPENIMIRHDGYVKVLDFGIAKLNERNKTDLDADTIFKTTPGMILGTVSYMSPEQARGEDVDARADIWSLGVVLYEMLSGRVPFDGVSNHHVLVSIQDQPPAPLPRRPDDFAAELERIILKALTKDRLDRYQTARDLFADLKRLEQEIEFRGKLEGTVTMQAHADRSAPARRGEAQHTLPIRLTPLIGRQAEIAAVRKLFGREAVRLITLTGPGGTGKTRLALQVATEMATEFRDGAVFVELAPIADPNLVVSAIAQTLGLKEAGAKSLLESLKEFLHEREMLLVIDNFEQVVDGAPVVAELLHSSPGLKILATSRAALRVSGEHEFAVFPLPVPGAGQKLSLDALAAFPAIELFVRRASAVKQGFSLTPQNADVIAQICSRLEGLPLAIELAAARVKVLSPPVLLSRLDNRLKILSGGARDLPPRQQTMRGAIAWSYDLLDENEQRLFRSVSVFIDGCTLEAIESVYNPSGDLENDLLEQITSLVDKSLLQQKELGNAEPRFTMLETIAEYGREQLSDCAEGEELARAHANYFLKIAETGEPELLGAQAEIWLDRFELEHGNLRAATRWCAANQQVEMGLRLAGAMWRFWELRGFLAEGRQVLQELLAADDSPAPTKARLKALYAAGILADSQRDYATARTIFAQQVTLHRELGDEWGVANSINNLGIIALRQRDYAAARALYEQSVGHWQKIGNQPAVALALGNLGNVADLSGDYETANGFYQQSLDLFKTMQDGRGVALSLHHLGDIARRQKDYERARSLYEQSLRILMELGDRRALGHLLTDMGNMAGECQNFDDARRWHEESMVIFSELGDVRGIAELFDAIMRIWITRGYLEPALCLGGAAARLREDFSAPAAHDEAARVKESLELIRGQLGGTASRAAWQEGRSMPAEKAIQFALCPDP